MITVLVCGGRNFDDVVLVHRTLSKLSADNTNLRIIHGDARGADALADQWARTHGHEVKAYPADWAKHGKSAGPIRNAKMLELDHPHLVVAFPGGDGTRDMCAKARRANVPLIIVAAPETL